MTKIEDKIESKNYVATEHDVELLAAAHLACSDATKRVDVSYLRILVAALQARFNGLRGRKKAAAPEDLKQHSEYLAETHTRLYAFVLKGVTTPDVMDEETLDPDTRRARAGVRNGRAAFARSSASTLQLYIRMGGDVRGLHVADVSKSQLRAFAKSKAPPTPRNELVLAGIKRVESEALSLAADDPDAAREVVEECMERLQKILDGLDKPDASTITQTLRARPAHTRQPAPAGRAHA